MLTDEPKGSVGAGSHAVGSRAGRGVTESKISNFRAGNSIDNA